MTDIINLNKERKKRRRAENERRAAENRTVYGLSKADKRSLKAEKEKTDKDHEGKKRE
ncbi:MAG: DUF4169 family protein [Pseudomonadota bacterium]